MQYRKKSSVEEVSIQRSQYDLSTNTQLELEPAHKAPSFTIKEVCNTLVYLTVRDTNKDSQNEAGV